MANNQNNSKTDEALVLFALACVLFVAFGWYFDRRKEPATTPFQQFAAWCSVVFYGTLACGVGLEYPFVSLVLGVWAGDLLARRLAVRIGVQVSYRDLASAIKETRYALAILLTAAAFSVGSLVGFPLGVIVAPTVIGLFGRAGYRYAKRMIGYRAAKWEACQVAGTVFSGVTAKTLWDGGAVVPTGGGAFAIEPPPPDLTAGLTDRAKIEERLSEVRPHLMLDPTSDYRRVEVIQVSDEVRERRETRATYGFDRVEAISHTQPAPGGMLDFSQEDVR